MNTLLQQQIGLTREAIAKIYMDFFVMYAETVATDTVAFQLMLINKPLQQWFARQFYNGEQRYFAFMARTAKPMKKDRALQMYLHFVTGFIDKFSKQIIYDIRKEAELIRYHCKRVGAKASTHQGYFN